MSKVVRNFNDKQRKLTDAEEKALEHIRKKSSGITSKTTKPLTPEEVKLQDVALKKGVRTGEFEGTLVTEDTLLEEQRLIEEKKRLFAEEFERQLKAWVDVEDHPEYDSVDFDHGDYLVRVFKMDVSEFENFVTLEYEWSPILKNLKLKDKPATENLFPIVKILKVGKGVASDKYKVGDICLVPSSDVLGSDWNPKFLQIMQYQNSQNMKPILPEGLRQSIPNVEKNWERYMFVRPWVPVPESKDYLTYLLPESKIRGSYKQ